MKKTITLSLAGMILFSFIVPTYAEKEWTFIKGKYQSVGFSYDIAELFSQIHEENDTSVTLTTQKKDMYLAITEHYFPGLSIEDINIKHDINDEYYVSYLWNVDPKDAIKSKLISVSAKHQGELEIIEYRFNATMLNMKCLAYHTILHVKNTGYFSEIKYFAQCKADGAEKLYYMNIIDSAIGNSIDTNNTIANKETNQNISKVSVFHKAEYSTYNMPASVNGLKDDLLLLEGTIESYNTLNGGTTEYIILRQDDGNKWVISVGQKVNGITVRVSGYKYRKADGKRIKVFCKYGGFSELLKLPACDVTSYGGILYVDENKFYCSKQAEIVMSNDGISIDDFLEHMSLMQ